MSEPEFPVRCANCCELVGYIRVAYGHFEIECPKCAADLALYGQGEAIDVDELKKRVKDVMSFDTDELLYPTDKP